MIEVLKQALEALESATVDCSNFHHAKKDQNHHLGECPPVIRWHHAIEAGKQAIKELESQEPLAWQVEVYIDGGWSPMGNPQRNKSRAEALASNPSIPKEKQRIVELYTHPPQRIWVGLTDEEIDKAWRSVDYTVPWEQHRIDIAQALEAKLKEKNS